MSGGWAPWRALLAVWLPAVLLCLASVAVYGWLSSDTLGREAQLRRDVAALEEQLEELKQIQLGAAGERQQVALVEGEVGRLQVEVFGSLDDRLTGILRAVGTATHDAGLRVGRYGYSSEEVRDLKLYRFGIQFAIDGEYPQVRRMLAALQASPEFLVVDRISFTGEEGAATRDLRIAVRLATYLAHADSERLRQLTGEPAAEEASDG
jgi:Tfp pilus assembly protein PilO